MIIKNTTRDKIVADDMKVANSFWSRLVGLMGKPALANGEALLIDPCNSVHTFFMRFPLDLIFLDKKGTVVRLVQSIPPWRGTRIVFGARSVLELPEYSIRKTETQIGDRLQIVG